MIVEDSTLVAHPGARTLTDDLASGSPMRRRAFLPFAFGLTSLALVGCGRKPNRLAPPPDATERPSTPGGDISAPTGAR